MKATPDILVADDDENDLRMIEMALKRDEPATTVRCVHDGDEALDYLYARGRFKERPAGNPGLILLDLHMPRIDGWEVLGRLKADDRFKVIPIVIFSSSAREGDIRHCYTLGANAYVVKPIDYALFRQTVGAIEAFWVASNQRLHARPPFPHVQTSNTA